MKRTVRLTESELRGLIDQCIYESIQSGEIDEGLIGKIGGAFRGAFSNLRNSFGKAMNTGTGIRGGLRNGWNNFKNIRQDVRHGMDMGDQKQEAGNAKKLFDELNQYIAKYGPDSMLARYIKQNAYKLSGVRNDGTNTPVSEPSGMQIDDYSDGETGELQDAGREVPSEPIKDSPKPNSKKKKWNEFGTEPVNLYKTNNRRPKYDASSDSFIWDPNKEQKWSKFTENLRKRNNPF